MKKRNLLIAAGVVAAGVCIWLIARPSKGPKVLLETAPISHITIRNSVTATGTVEPVTQVEVGTQVSGIIDKLYADYNDQVKAGQLIAEMDKVTLQAELESAQAQLASSKTEYEYQTKNYARTKTLHEKQLVSDAEYDQAFYLYETARNAYEQSQATPICAFLKYRIVVPSFMKFAFRSLCARIVLDTANIMISLMVIFSDRAFPCFP